MWTFMLHERPKKPIDGEKPIGSGYNEMKSRLKGGLGLKPFELEAHLEKGMA